MGASTKFSTLKKAPQKATDLLKAAREMSGDALKSVSERVMPSSSSVTFELSGSSYNEDGDETDNPLEGIPVYADRAVKASTRAISATKKRYSYADQAESKDLSERWHLTLNSIEDLLIFLGTMNDIVGDTPSIHVEGDNGIPMLMW